MEANKITETKHSSRINDVEAGLESSSSRKTASLTDAVHPAVISERKAGHEHDAFPEGIALVSILAAVAVSFFLVFLDMAIMSTVTPAVTSRLKALTDVGWYASAYQLTSAACTPLTGKIYTFFHIRWSFLVFFLIFEIGSALSGAANSSNMFIVGRAVSGIGSAGLFTGMMTIVANVLPLHKRPVILGAIMGLGQLGIADSPLIGGAFTSNAHATWRWCFYLNLCLFPIITVAFLLNTIPEAEVKPHWRNVLATAVKSLDLVGFVLISGGVLMFLSGLQYGVNQFAWDSSVVIGLIAGGVVSFSLFLAWEYHQGDGAMVPWAMLRSGIIRAAAITGLFNYGVMLVADYYLAIYFHAVPGRRIGDYMPMFPEHRENVELIWRQSKGDIAWSLFCANRMSPKHEKICVPPPDDCSAANVVASADSPAEWRDTLKWVPLLGPYLHVFGLAGGYATSLEDPMDFIATDLEKGLQSQFVGKRVGLKMRKA